MRRGEGSIATDITEEGVQEAVRMDLDLMNKINGDSHITKNRTFMKHVRPIKQQYYPRNPAMQAIINEKVDELLLHRTLLICLHLTSRNRRK